MKQPTRISKGTVKVPVSTQLMLDYVAERNSVSLSVPATAVAGRFLFDIRSYLSTLGMDIPIQAQIVINIANLFMKYQTVLGHPVHEDDKRRAHFDVSRLENTPAMSYLKTLFTGDALQELLDEAYTGIQRSLIRGSMADAILLSTLADEKSVIESLALNQTKIDINVVSKAMQSMQDINSQILKAKDLGSISTSLQAILSDEFFSTISALKSVFQERKSPSVIVMRNEVEDQLLPLFGFEPNIIRSEVSVNGLLEKITEIDNSLDETPRVAFLATYMRIIRMWMGVDWTKPFNTLTLSQMITASYAGHVDMPAILTDFSNNQLLDHPLTEDDMNKVANFFCRRVAVHLIRSIASGEPGVLKGKYMSLLDSRAYKKADIYNYLIERTFDLLSYAHSAMCSALGDLASIAFSDTLYFPYEKPWKTAFMKEFFEAWLSRYREHRLSSDNLREILEPANILEGADPNVAHAPIPGFFFDDRVTNDYNALKYDAVEDRYFGYFGSITPKQGVLTDAPVDLPVNVIARHTAFFVDQKPIYMMQVPYAGIGGYPLDTPYAEMVIRSIQPKEIIGSHLQNYFESLSQYSFYTNYQDLMQAWNLDSKTAEVIWGSLPKMRKGVFESLVYLRYIAPLKRTIIWERDVAPIYEFGPEPEYETMVPYMDVYPAMCYIETDGFMNDSSLRDLMIAKAIAPRGMNPNPEAPQSQEDPAGNTPTEPERPNPNPPTETTETTTQATQPFSEHQQTTTPVPAPSVPAEAPEGSSAPTSPASEMESQTTSESPRRKKKTAKDNDDNNDQ